MKSLYGKADLDDIATKIVMLSPEMAKVMRTEFVFERQRPICEANVDRLAREIVNETFVPGTPILIAVLPNLSKRLLNGGHICEAIMKTGLAIPVVLITVRVSNLEEAATIYSALDRQKARTMTRVGAGKGNRPGQSECKRA